MRLLNCLSYRFSSSMKAVRRLTFPPPPLDILPHFLCVLVHVAAHIVVAAGGVRVVYSVLGVWWVCVVALRVARCFIFFFFIIIFKLKRCCV